MIVRQRFHRSVYLTLGLACACLGYAEVSFLPEITFLAVLVAGLLFVAYRLEDRWALSLRAANIIGIQTAAPGNPLAISNRSAGRRVGSDPSGLLAESIAEKIGWIRHEAGSRFDAIELSLVSSVVLAENRREAAERLMRQREWDGISVDRVLEMPSIFIGSVDQIVNEMQVRRERYGISYHVVRDSGLETLAPIVSRLAGV